MISQHPEIWMPRGETPYFEDPDYHQSTPDEFLSQFPHESGKLIGIKRPNYIGKPEAPERIETDLPDARLIAVLRDPADRAISAYFHQIRYGTLPAIPAEKGFEKIITGDRAWFQRFERAEEILEFGMYNKHLKNYSKSMCEGRLKIILQEDIKRDPLKQIQDCLQFLGVDPKFRPSQLDARPQKVVYNLARLRVLRLQNLFLYRYNSNRTRLYPKKMTPFSRLCVRSINRFDNLIAKRMLPDSQREPSSSLREKLVTFYADDVKGLSSLIQRDLSHWLIVRRHDPA